MAPRPSFSLHLSLDCLFCPLASPPPPEAFPDSCYPQGDIE